MEKELFEKFEETAEKVTQKIIELEDGFQDLRALIGKYESQHSDVMADALNELLKMGLVPGVRICLVNGREYTVQRYTYNRITCVDSEGNEIGTDLNTMFEKKDRWEILK